MKEQAGQKEMQSVHFEEKKSTRAFTVGVKDCSEKR